MLGFKSIYGTDLHMYNVCRHDEIYVKYLEKDTELKTTCKHTLNSVYYISYSVYVPCIQVKKGQSTHVIIHVHLIVRVTFVHVCNLLLRLIILVE